MAKARRQVLCSNRRCGIAISVPQEKVGGYVNCPRCSTRVKVPENLSPQKPVSVLVSGNGLTG